MRHSRLELIKKKVKNKNLTNVLRLLHNVPLPDDRVGQQKRIVLDARQQRSGHPHLILEAQIQPGQILRGIQQIAARPDDAVQQLEHDILALSLVGERFNVVRHFLGHGLDDFGRDQHVAAVQRFAARHLGQVVGDADEGGVTLVDAHLEAVQPEAATVGEVRLGRLPGDRSEWRCRITGRRRSIVRR